MSTSDLGTKQICPNCEAKFYDLNKRPAVCPKCQHTFEPDAEEIASVRAKVAASVAPAAGAKDDEDEDDIDEAKAAVGEDDEEGDGETIAELGDENDPALAVNDSADDDEDASAKGGVPAGFSEQGVDDADDILADDDEETFDIDVDDIGDEDDLPGE